MRIEIEIPKEFEEHYNQDKFKDSLERIMADIKHSLDSENCLCAGRYEYETIEMLEKAFENSKSVYSVDKIVKKLEENARPVNVIGYGTTYEAINKDVAIKIVKQSSVSDDVCEWKYNDSEYC